MDIKTVPAAHGWRWIADGVLLFRKNAPIWLLMLGVLFIGSRVLFYLPLIGLIAVLVTPNFVAGLMHGAQALDQGKPLRFTYLISGFLRNAAPLVTLGGIWLVGQFLLLMVMEVVGGEAIINLSQSMVNGLDIPPATLEAAGPALTRAALAGLALSVPLLMALWFAPLLVFFDNLKPLAALGQSFKACAKNFAPFMVYGLATIAPLLLLAPLGAGMGQPDLGLWLLAPLLAPSLYTSYRDVFAHSIPAPPTSPESVN
jgi:hypothetical protein